MRLHNCLFDSFTWATTPEKDTYWHSMYMRWSLKRHIENEQELVTFLKSLTRSSRPTQGCPDYTYSSRYEPLKLIARYYTRFDALPSVKLLKELISDGVCI